MAEKPEPKEKSFEGPTALLILLILAVPVLVLSINYRNHMQKLNDIDRRIQKIQIQQDVLMQILELDEEELEELNPDLEDTEFRAPSEDTIDPPQKEED